MRTLEADSADTFAHFVSLPNLPINPISPGRSISNQAYQDGRPPDLVPKHLLDVGTVFTVNRHAQAAVEEIEIHVRVP